MIELTAEAKNRLDEYLQRMRSALRGSRAIEPEEVEQNVREHVDIALAAVPAPVGAEHLARVLEQLGAPERWLPDDDRPVWRRVASRLVSGPEDWRLAYLSFAVTFLMVLFFPVGGVLLLLPAYLLSRASVEVVAERGEPLGARRWLVLPPIFLVAAFLFGIALFVPIAGLSAFVLNERPYLEHEWVFGAYIAAVAGAWWIALSGLFALLLAQIQTLIKPFGATWKRRHALVLTAAGVVLLAAGGALLVLTGG